MGPIPPSTGTPVMSVPSHVACARSLPEAEGSVENDSFEVAESQAIMSRLQWDGASDISPSDSASSKASECLGWGQILPHSPLCRGKPSDLGISSAWEGTDRQTAAVRSHHNPQGRGGHPLVLGYFFLGVDWWGGISLF